MLENEFMYTIRIEKSIVYNEQTKSCSSVRPTLKRQNMEDDDDVMYHQSNENLSSMKKKLQLIIQI